LFDHHQNQLRTFNDNVLVHAEAKRKLHGWSSDGALLMRRRGGRERADKRDPPAND